MRKLTILFCGIAIFTTSPDSVMADTLMQVYTRALNSDPSLREAEANRLAVMESKPQARSALLPQINGTAGYSWDESDGSNSFQTAQVVENPPGSGNFEQIIRTVDSEFEQKDTNVTQWRVELRQSLFRWDQWVRLDQADKEATQADVDYRAAEQDLMTRVAEAYFNVLAAQDTLDSEQAAKEAIGRQLEQAEKRFEVGLIAITDVQEAQAGYDQAVATEISAKRDLASRQELLREIVGELPEELSKPKEQIPLLNPEPQDETQWVDISMEQNLRLVSGRIGAEIARDNVSLARTGHYPTVDLVASRFRVDSDGLRSDNNDAFRDTAFDQTQDSIQLQLSVPIFSGLGTSSQVKEAVYRHRAAKESLERTARETERQTRDAYLGVISEISRVKALTQALKSANTALRATEAGFDVGTRTTVDVLDSRRQLFIAETNYARSRYDYIINVLLLKQAAGTLTSNDLIEVNNWLEPEPRSTEANPAPVTPANQ
jgi:outer membrane protein